LLEVMNPYLPIGNPMTFNRHQKMLVHKALKILLGKTGNIFY
jgi:hypothetical protein